MRAISIGILLITSWAAIAAEKTNSPDWVYIGPAQLESALRPISAKSYIKPDEVSEKSGLRFAVHRMVFAKAQPSVNRKYVKEAREEVAISCVDGTVGIVTVSMFDPEEHKLGTKVIAKKGLEMKSPDNDHHRRLVEAVCEIQMKSEK